jgi:hypothetical protein
MGQCQQEPARKVSLLEFQQPALAGSRKIAKRESQAAIVFIVCDRGDRYQSTGVFPA